MLPIVWFSDGTMQTVATWLTMNTSEREIMRKQEEKRENQTLTPFY